MYVAGKSSFVYDREGLVGGRGGYACVRRGVIDRQHQNNSRTHCSNAGMECCAPGWLSLLSSHKDGILVKKLLGGWCCCART